MRNILFAGVALSSLFAGSAMAADLPVRAPVYKGPPPVVVVYNWSGFYIGGNIGGAWGRSDTNSSLTNVDCGALVCYIDSVVADINNQAAQRLSASAFTGGFQAGFNAQFGSFVGGVEVDINSFRLSGSNVKSAYFTGFPGPGLAPTYTDSFSTSWLLTARGRLGVAANNWLFYGTAGLAATNLGYDHTYTEGTFGGSSSGTESSNASGTKYGYAVGGGVEYGFGNWSVKGEYLYVHFSDVSSTAAVLFPGVIGGSTFSHTANLSASIARLGLNYRFGGGPGYANY